MTNTIRMTLAMIMLAAGLAGCADPYAATTSKPAPPPGELTGTTTAHAPATAPSLATARLATPAALISQAVKLTGNWTGVTVVARYRQFVDLTTGAAHHDAASASVRLGTDPQLTATDTTSRATLASVALTGTGRRRRGILVTHEIITASGQTTRSYRVTLATLRRKDTGGWLLSAWQPQP